ncbi:MAG: acetate--CoA ligase family protein [Dehalococcoidia bacterium]|nr:acetate--CoA ligase family protein [Dehalococcoidia bacterium]
MKNQAERLEEKSAEREMMATVASLKGLLSPRSVAVIGASRDEGSIGNKLFRNVLLHGFTGVVYPVNPNAPVVASVKAYPTVLDIPGEVDLAVVVVPGQFVNGVVEQCAKKGVKGVVVISAGFRETGPEGAGREKELLSIARRNGIRIIGPNCMGVINTHSSVSMNATFSPVFPPSGGVAFCTQSGALGLAILEYARSLNMGLSTFVSIGNRVDVSSNDLLEYWQDDPATRIILLYLESFGNPKKFARSARSVSLAKPVIVVKSGRTPAGSRAAASHTGALAATEVGAEALSRQAGVVRVDTLEELFDVATLLSHQPVPKGRRVAIITNGGGPGILTADACAARGLELPVPGEKTRDALQGALAKGSSLANPIDMTAEATAEHYRRTLEILAEDPELDIVIVIFIPPILTQPEAVAAAIRETAPAYRKQGKTLVASFMGSRGAAVNLGSAAEGYVPSFIFPETTASALSAACGYGEWLRKPKGSVPKLKNVDAATAQGLVERARERSTVRPFWLDPASTSGVLEAYGIRVPQYRVATTSSEAKAAAAEIGFPVAIKLFSRTLTHKTDVGGVVLDVNSPEEAERAYDRIAAKLLEMGHGGEMHGVVVQRMVKEGVEVIVGVTQDPSFGPLVMFGMGGVYAELFKDVAFRLHPLTDVDAADLVRSVKTYRVLEGWRGAGPADIESLEDLLLRVSAMAEDLPQIVELDLNPVKVLGTGKGCLSVDARIMVA